MLTAGNEEPIVLALKRMIAMRNFMRGKKVDNAVLTEVLNEVGLTEDKVDDMYKTMALAAYEDRFVIPTNHKEYSGDTPFDNEIIKLRIAIILFKAKIIGSSLPAVNILAK
jgi:nitrate reductase beta subunit